MDLMLPQVYDDTVEVKGWLMSEKLDGVRGYWNGEQLLSKNGNLLYPPQEFIKNFPPFPMEGELWGGHGTFEKTVSTVTQNQANNGWLQLHFAIFDVPQAQGEFVHRLEKLTRWFDQHPSIFAYIIPQTIVENKTHLINELKRIETLGGEGLIVRKPDGLYNNGRSAEILKVKSFFDTEATVLAHIQGKGKNQNRLGSLLVEQPDGIRFKIGGGFSDDEREIPPPVGSIITFKYYGFYQSGIPKFPSFLRIRTDTSL